MPTPLTLPEEFPTTELAFETAFGDEEKCRDYLMRLRWPDGFRCPTCRLGTKYWPLNGRVEIECAECHHQTSVTAGTILHGTRKPLRLWLRAMFLMAGQKLGLSAKNFQRMMGLGSYQTAWTWLHKLRSVMVVPGRRKLGAKVEVDESYFTGGANDRSGRASEDPMVVAAVEREGRALGCVRMQVISCASSSELVPFVERSVQPGATVVTDGWNAYMSLKVKGYVHDRRVIGEDASTAVAKLPGVHRVFSLVQRVIVGTHQGAVSPKHLQAYLDEYCFRFNRRKAATPFRIFHRLAEAAMRGFRRTYRQIVAVPICAVPRGCAGPT